MWLAFFSIRDATSFVESLLLCAEHCPSVVAFHADHTRDVGNVLWTISDRDVQHTLRAPLGKRQREACLVGLRQRGRPHSNFRTSFPLAFSIDTMTDFLNVVTEEFSWAVFPTCSDGYHDLFTLVANERDAADKIVAVLAANNSATLVSFKNVSDKLENSLTGFVCDTKSCYTDIARTANVSLTAVGSGFHAVLFQCDQIPGAVVGSFSVYDESMRSTIPFTVYRFDQLGSGLVDAPGILVCSDQVEVSLLGEVFQERLGGYYLNDISAAVPVCNRLGWILGINRSHEEYPLISFASKDSQQVRSTIKGLKDLVAIF